MATATWSGSFGGTSAGTSGLTATVSNSGATVPLNAIITKVECMVNVSAGWTSSDFYWTLHWFQVQSGSTVGAAIGTVGVNDSAGVEIQCPNKYSGGVNQNVTATMSLSNQNVFNNGSLTVNVKANIPQNGSPRTVMNEVTVTVTYYTFVWSGTPSLSAVHNGGGSVTITLNGSATTDSGAAISYQVLVGSSSIGNLNSSKQLTVSRSPGTETYTCRAYATIGGATRYTSNNPSVSLTIPAPNISWVAGSNLSATPGDGNVFIALNGNAVIGNGYGGNIYYRVFCETTRKNSDGDASTTWTVTPTALDVALTYYVDAYVTIGGTTYTTTKLSVAATVSGGNFVSYYNGTQWVQCKAYYYNGSSWAECKPYYYNGSSWVEISSPS